MKTLRFQIIIVLALLSCIFAADVQMGKRNIQFNVLIFASVAPVLIFYLWWSRTSTLKPIRKLTEIAQKISKGDLTESIEVKSNDEVGYLASAFDTMRVKISELIEDNENARRDWESTFDSIDDIITIFNTDNGLIKYNKALVSSLNIKPIYIAEEKCYDFSYNNNNNDSLLGSRIKEVSKVDRAITVEVEEPDIDCVFSISNFPRFNSTGEFVGTAQITRDITERKLAENDIRESHREIELLLSSITSIIISLTPDRRIAKLNKAAETTFKIDAASVVGTPFRECDIRWDWNIVIEKVSICQETNSSTWIDDLRYKRPDGSYGDLGVTINPIANDSGSQSGVLLLGMDVTERKDMVHQLMHAQKLESIGQLAAGIAHEINTPIQYITDNTNFLQNAFRDINKLLEKYSRLCELNKSGSVASELAAEIEVVAGEVDIDFLMEEIPAAVKQSLYGLNRVKDIVYAMKNFSHPENENRIPIDINEAIKNTIVVTRNEWKYVAEIKTDFDLSLTSVPCFPGDFNQIILNLIVNAAHAIGDVLKSGNDGKGIINVSTVRDGDWAEIRIGDTGTGIREDIRARIFDPFFTTKEVGKGTGQGLSLVHSSVVRRHHGTIALDTEAGKGSTFIIRLPISACA